MAAWVPGERWQLYSSIGIANVRPTYVVARNRIRWEACKRNTDDVAVTFWYKREFGLLS